MTEGEVVIYMLLIIMFCAVVGRTAANISKRMAEKYTADQIYKEQADAKTIKK